MNNIIKVDFNIEDQDQFLLDMVLVDRLKMNFLYDMKMDIIKKKSETDNVHIIGIIKDLAEIISYKACGETFPRDAVEYLLMNLEDYTEEDINNISYQKVRKDLLEEERARINSEILKILKRSIWNQKTNDDLDYIFQTIIGEVI